jgi:hypothetical protein
VYKQFSVLHLSWKEWSETRQGNERVDLHFGVIRRLLSLKRIMTSHMGLVSSLQGNLLSAASSMTQLDVTMVMRPWIDSADQRRVWTGEPRRMSAIGALQLSVLESLLGHVPTIVYGTSYNIVNVCRFHDPPVYYGAPETSPMCVPYLTHLFHNGHVVVFADDMH